MNIQENANDYIVYIAGKISFLMLGISGVAYLVTMKEALELYALIATCISGTLTVILFMIRIIKESRSISRRDILKAILKIKKRKML